MASNFFNKASLVMVPDAPIDGKLPSVKPEDRSGDFTFSRGSNLAATRVNKDGLIEKGRENILLYSNTFSSWTIINSTLTPNQAGYDNTSDAWLIEKTADAGRIQINVDAGLATYSVYAKAGSVSWIRLLKGGNASAYFDLSNGTIGDLALTIDATITSVGGGWYRCTMTYEDAFSGSVRIYPAIADGDTSGTSGNIYIQDAQLEQGLVATDYIETGASTAQAGILENLPRIDYSGGASCPSLLLEPQRTNLIVNSEYFGASNWTTLRSSIALSSVTSPEGVGNAYKLTTDSAANNTHIIYYGGTLTSNTYSLSLYAKSAEFSKIGLGTGNLTLSAKFDLSSGSVITEGVHTASIESAGNDWYRCTIVTTTTTPIRIVLLDNNGNISFDGDGTSGLYIFGHQAEVGSYPTSYIPAYGSSVTRSQDVGTQLNFSNFFDGYDFTMFLELKDNDSLVRADSSNNFRISDTGGNNYGAIRIYRASSSATKHRIVFQDNSQNFDPSSVSVDSENPKIIVRRIYDTGEFKVFVDGVLRSTATNTDYDIFRFIDFAGGGSSMNIKQIALFGTALTDDECIALTTI